MYIDTDQCRIYRIYRIYGIYVNKQRTGHALPVDAGGRAKDSNRIYMDLH